MSKMGPQTHPFDVQKELLISLKSKNFSLVGQGVAHHTEIINHRFGDKSRVPVIIDTGRVFRLESLDLSGFRKRGGDGQSWEVSA